MSSASSSPCWHGNVTAVITVDIQVAVMVVVTVGWSHRHWCGGGGRLVGGQDQHAGQIIVIKLSSLTAVVVMVVFIMVG